MSLEVLGTWTWERRTGYRGQLPLVGKVTHVRDAAGREAIVRENLRLHSSFNISSSARLNFAGGHGKSVGFNPDRTSHGKQILEMACQDESHVPHLRVQIAAADGRRRAVVQNRQWTWTKALQSKP